MRRFLITSSAILTTFLVVACLSRADDSLNPQPKDLPKNAFQPKPTSAITQTTLPAPGTAYSSPRAAQIAHSRVLLDVTLLRLDSETLKKAHLDPEALKQASGFDIPYHATPRKPRALGDGTRTARFENSAAQHLIQRLIKAGAKPSIQSMKLVGSSGRPVSVDKTAQLPTVNIPEVVNGKIQIR